MEGDKSHLGRLLSLSVVFVFIVALVVSFTTVQAGKLEGRWTLVYSYDPEVHDYLRVHDSAGFTRILGSEEACHKYSKEKDLTLFWVYDGDDVKQVLPKGRKIRIELIDPSGIVYSSSPSKEVESYSHVGALWGDVPCPDYSRPGYWKFVVVDVETSSVLDELPFYVQPKEHKGFSVQAICGPAFVIGLTLLPLVALRRRRVS